MGDESGNKVCQDAHIVEIHLDEKNKISHWDSYSAKNPQHPLQEIADSRGHLLLLKLWQREEEIVSSHIEAKESRIHSIGSEIFHLGCFFFAFHGFLQTLVFTAANEQTCTRWWIPASFSFMASMAVIFAIQYKMIVEGKVMKLLQRDKAHLRAVNRCMQELRMKGMSFDLSKEPQAAKKWKSSSVVTKWSPLKWVSSFFWPISLLLISGLMLWSCKLMACSS